MQQYVIIVAGGTGSRLNGGIPKQFIRLDDKEIIIHTIQKFTAYNKNIRVIVSVHQDHSALLRTLLEKNNLAGVEVINGGATRYHSVKNGLDLVKDNDAVVGIHDAARPFVSRDTISRCYRVAAEKGNAVPYTDLHESIREVTDKGNKTVNRNLYKIIQTPQCFLVPEIKKAFGLPYSESFTDDASVLEAAGGKINLVEGNYENIKITLPKDLLIAKLFLENE